MLIPLIPFGIAVIIIAVIIYLNILNNKIQQVPLVLALINAVSFLAYIPFYNKQIENEWFLYLFYSHSGITILLLIFILIFLLVRIVFFKQHYKIFLNSVQTAKNNTYFVVDKKNKIKEMSGSLLNEIGLTFKEVKAKNLFDIFNRSIRITHYDNIETNNRSVETLYETYSKEVKKEQIDNHIYIFQNHKGQSILMRTTEQPLFILGKYKGRVNIGEMQSDFNLLEVEQKLKQASYDLESLRLKYIATIEIVNQGLYYIDLDDKTFWASQTLVKKLQLSTDMINFEDYQKYIYEDDINSYLGSLSNLTTRKDTFKTRYRFLVNGQYLWVTDHGKRIFEDKQSNLIMGTIDTVEASGYSKTGLEVLDNLKTEKYLIPHLTKLIKENKTFELALFNLHNLPEINEEYGREVGNMMISEYVKKLMGSFMSESSDIFRIAGVTFAVTIVDPRKISLLRKGVINNPAFLNLKMNYGVISPEIEVKMGVVSSPKDSKEANELFSFAKQAINLTKHKDYNSHVCYYGDLND